MGSRSVILAPFPCVQAALSVLQIAKSKITTYPGARPFLVPLPSRKFCLGPPTFPRVVPAALPRRESRKSLLRTWCSPPRNSNSFPNVDFLCFFLNSENRTNLKKRERERASYHRAQRARRPGTERGTPPGSVGPKCGAHSVVGAQHSRHGTVDIVNRRRF